MAKIYDLTDKLSFDESPVIKIKGEEIGINDDAITMLKVMEAVGNAENEAAAVSRAFNLLFSEKDRKKIEKLKLSYRDFHKFVSYAMALVTGNDPEEAAGE